MNIEISACAGNRRTNDSGEVTWNNPKHSQTILVACQDLPDSIDSAIDEALDRLRIELRMMLNVEHYVWHVS
jgi:hypothetical protein